MTCMYNYLLVWISNLAMCFSVEKYLCSLKLTQIASFILTHFFFFFSLSLHSYGGFFVYKKEKSAYHWVNDGRHHKIYCARSYAYALISTIANSTRKNTHKNKITWKIYINISHSHSFFAPPCMSTFQNQLKKQTTYTKKSLKSSKFHAKYFSFIFVFFFIFVLLLCINMWFCCMEYEMIGCEIVFRKAPFNVKSCELWIL